MSIMLDGVEVRTALMSTFCVAWWSESSMTDHRGDHRRAKSQRKPEIQAGFEVISCLRSGTLRLLEPIASRPQI